MLESLKKMKKIKAIRVPTISGFHVEIDKSHDGYSVVTSGVSRVAELSEDVVKLKCRKGVLTVKGCNLTLSLYENKTVEISGKLKGVDF